jgi:AraC-like DNA-binding protein
MNDFIGLAKDYPADHRIPPHAHEGGQLLFATAGSMNVTVGARTWLVATERAMWIPANTRHHIRACGALSMRTLYVARHRAPLGDTRVVRATPLLRELIVHAATNPVRDAAGARLVEVLFDRLRDAPRATASIALPDEPRVRKVATALVGHPGDSRTIGEWARLAGTSDRTLARLFVRHTGMSFRAWREHVRLIHAEALVEAGVDVTSIALELGYESVSAFITMFRRNFGQSPGRYASLLRVAH